ncbi:MAG: YceI family protein [Bacteroidetes bacterium]|nr:YceI family protein [Bacteroidota bacterium]
MNHLIVILIAQLFAISSFGQEGVWKVTEGDVRFVSDAPLERIEASTKEVNGVMVISSKKFAFSISNLTFKGFNSPLQQQHFYENYMETHKFSTSTFVGRIVEEVDLSEAGTYEIRAKGKLNIHGVSRERIIKVTITSDGESFRAESYFTVLLEEHDIEIPKIVHQKISEEIEIRVDVVFNPGE